MLDLLSSFVIELRSAGLPVSLTEHLDAARALHEIPLEQRSTVKSTLAATLVKDAEHYAAFDLAFEVFFAARTATSVDLGENSETGDDDDGAGDKPSSSLPGQGNGKGAGGGGGAELSAEELAKLLLQALRNNDPQLASQVAQAAVTRYAGMEPGRPVGGTYYLYRTLRNLDLEGAMKTLIDEAKATKEMTNLDERLVSEEIGARLEKLKKAIEAEIRRRLVADRGAEALAKSVRKPLPEDIDVMHATRDELELLRKTLQPLSRKLAVRLARKRRHRRRGPLDIRRTIRQSLSTGGVPLEPRFKNPRPAKPEMVVIADISGSVASFARFTLHLVYALSSQFSKIRSFVFVDGIDEVTRYFSETDDPVDAIARINTEADVIWVDGHSDYGHAFIAFKDRYSDAITSKSTVLIIGDARNNYHRSESWVIGEIAEKARHVYWLNPEPQDYWNSGDSIVGDYATYCDGIVECRTLRQLERFVGDLA